MFSRLASAAPTLHALHEEISEIANQLSERPSLFIQCQLRFAMDCEELRRIFFEKFIPSGLLATTSPWWISRFQIFFYQLNLIV
jgi:hypothetical protein